MDHFDTDAHKKESQICILVEGSELSGARSPPSLGASPRRPASGRTRGSSSSPRQRPSASPGAWRSGATRS